MHNEMSRSAVDAPYLATTKPPTMPSVSIIIPCFNAGEYLIQSVTSALDQQGDFGSLDVIVVDDRSEDEGTQAALSALGEMTRVTVLSNHGAKGSAAARNLGIREAKGEWVAFLDADDWWPEDSLARRFAALRDHPDASWISGDFLELNRDGSAERVGRFERNLDTYDFLKIAYANGRSIRLDTPLLSFLSQAPTHTIVTLIKRDLLNRVGGFDESLLRQQDYHLFLRLAAVAPFVFVPSVVACYRHHASNSTRSLTHTQGWRIKALGDLLVRPEFFSVKTLLRRRIGQLHLSNAYEYRKEGRYQEAVNAAWRCIVYGGNRFAAWKSLAAALFRR